MNPRDIVLEQIRHHETVPVPYTLAFEQDVYDRLDRHFGGDAWRGKVIPYIKSCGGVARPPSEKIDATHYRDAFGTVWREQLPLAPQPDPLALESLAGRFKAGIDLPLTSSLGRLFDGVAFILGVTDRNRFEADAAMTLETLAADGEATALGGAEDLATADGIILDPRPLIRELVAGRQAGQPARRALQASKLTLRELGAAQRPAILVRLGRDHQTSAPVGAGPPPHNLPAPGQYGGTVRDLPRVPPPGGSRSPFRRLQHQRRLLRRRRAPPRLRSGRRRDVSGSQVLGSPLRARHRDGYRVQGLHCLASPRSRLPFRPAHADLQRRTALQC